MCPALASQELQDRRAQGGTESPLRPAASGQVATPRPGQQQDVGIVNTTYGLSFIKY